MKQNKQSGFSLIELLVVISIIGMLASITLVNVNSARAKAKDAKRMADKKQLITALNLYYDSNNGWPSSAGTWKCLAATSESCWNGSYTGLDSIVTGMAPYIGTFPKNNAPSGQYAFDRMLYHSNLIAGGWTPGAYLIWVSESTIPTSNCPSSAVPQHYDNYWYCYEYLGQ